MHCCLLISPCPIQASPAPLMSALSFAWARIQAGTCPMLSAADLSSHLVHTAELALLLLREDHRYTGQRIWHIVGFKYGFVSSTFTLVLFWLMFTWLFLSFFHVSMLVVEDEITVSHLKVPASWTLRRARNSFVSMLHYVIDHLIQTGNPATEVSVQPWGPLSPQHYRKRLNHLYWVQ